MEVGEGAGAMSAFDKMEIMFYYIQETIQLKKIYFHFLKTASFCVIIIIGLFNNFPRNVSPVNCPLTQTHSPNF
jgi:hypothetical protein